MRKGKEAKTVPASVRCKPSTRMSLSLKGSAAQAEVVCKAAQMAMDKALA